MEDNIEKVLNERFLLQEEYLGVDKVVNRVVPLVSVTVTTYQHVNYIKECLDGILMQKVDFPYEIIIGDDDSSDGTQEVCKEYAEKYPDKIRLFIRDRKLSHYTTKDGKSIRFNGVWNRMAARGKYIAWCEGDDYWTDPHKLQKQVDILEANPKIGLVYSRARINNTNRTIGRKGDSKVSLYKANFIPTLTTLFRVDILKKYLKSPFSRKQYMMGDYPIWLWFNAYSSIYFLDLIVGAYNVKSESASHFTDKGKQLDFSVSSLEVSLDFGGKFLSSKEFSKLVNYRIRHVIFSSIKNKSVIRLKLYIKKFQKYDLSFMNKIALNCLDYVL